MLRKAVSAPLAKPKRARSLRPNLKQHNLPAPYARLLTFGDNEPIMAYNEIASELRGGDASAAVSRLLAMALDESYYEYWDEAVEDPRVWTRLHALRVLQRIGEAAQAAIVPLLPLLGEEDDYLREEMPIFYAALGPAVIEPLARTLMDPEADMMERSGAGDALAELAEALPESRGQIVGILEQALIAAQDDETMVGFVICNLLDVGAKESVPLIRQAFAEGRVDESVVELIDVEEHFDLPRTAERPDWRSVLEDRQAAIERTAQEPDHLDGDSIPPAEESSTPYVAPYKVGRNEPCPCGSGKKYKKCCGA